MFQASLMLSKSITDLFTLTTSLSDDKQCASFLKKSDRIEKINFFTLEQKFFCISGLVPVEAVLRTDS
jgi:hypothetical protein